MNSLTKLQIQDDKIEYVFKNKTYIINVIHTNNKNMYLTFTRGDFFLKKPKHFSQQDALTFVEENIIKLISKQELNKLLRIPEFIDFDSGWFFLFGKKENFFVQQKGLDYFIIGNNFQIKIKSLDKEEMETQIKNWILPLFHEKAIAITQKVEQKMQAVTHKVEVHQNRSAWGTNGIYFKIISYNLNLAHFSEEFLEYIAIHEVTHSFEANHSPRFRAILRHYCPNWKELDKKLALRIVY